MCSPKSLITYTNIRSLARKGVCSWKRNSWRWPCEYTHESWDSSLARPSLPFIWPANEKHTDNTCSYIRPEQVAMLGLSTNARQRELRINVASTIAFADRIRSEVKRFQKETLLVTNLFLKVPDFSLKIFVMSVYKVSTIFFDYIFVCYIVCYVVSCVR